MKIISGVCIATVLLAPISMVKVNAQLSALDGTFGSGGFVTTSMSAFGFPYSSALNMVLQNDGKILVAGFTSGSFGDNFALVRYLPNGTPDSSFNFDGIVMTDFGSSMDEGYAVAVQSDGKIIVAGTSDVGGDRDFALVRYNSDGSIDNSFDTDGKVTTNMGGTDDRVRDMFIQPDGKIVVAGYRKNFTSADFAMARYNQDGSLDVSFDVDGKITTDFYGGIDEAYSVVMQSDGKILVGGFCSTSTQKLNFALARYNTNGTLDNSFDVDGKLNTDFANEDDLINAITLQPDGKIIAAGYMYDSTGAIYSLARYNTDGSLDNTFDSDGLVLGGTIIAGQHISASDVMIQSDGKIVAAGNMLDNYYDFTLFRFNTNGSPDLTFDSDGVLHTDFGNSSDIAYSGIVLPDGKILVAGSKQTTGASFVVARYYKFGSSIGDTLNAVENIEALQLGIYPNPAINEICIHVEDQLKNASINLCDATGRPIYDKLPFTGINDCLDLSRLQPGTYFVYLIVENQVVVRRIVKM